MNKDNPNRNTAAMVFLLNILSKETVKVLKKCLQRAWRDGDVRVVRRIAGLLCLAQTQSIDEAAAFCGVCTDTIKVDNWLTM